MSLPVLPDRTVKKLGAVCGLLGSDHAGERANAASAATKLLKAHGLTWRQLVEMAFTVAPTQPAKNAQPPPPSWKEQAAVCELHQHRLTGWEQQFVAAMRQWTSAPSTKQQAVLTRLYVKVTTP